MPDAYRPPEIDLASDDDESQPVQCRPTAKRARNAIESNGSETEPSSNEPDPTEESEGPQSEDDDAQMEKMTRKEFLNTVCTASVFCLHTY
jgi:hypothetical protein